MFCRIESANFNAFLCNVSNCANGQLPQLSHEYMVEETMHAVTIFNFIITGADLLWYKKFESLIMTSFLFSFTYAVKSFLIIPVSVNMAPRYFCSFLYVSQPESNFKSHFVSSSLALMILKPDFLKLIDIFLWVNSSINTSHLILKRVRLVLRIRVSSACNRQCKQFKTGSFTHFSFKILITESINVMNSITDEDAPCLIPV